MTAADHFCPISPPSKLRLPRKDPHLSINDDNKRTWNGIAANSVKIYGPLISWHKTYIFHARKREFGMNACHWDTTFNTLVLLIWARTRSTGACIVGLEIYIYSIRTICIIKSRVKVPRPFNAIHGYISPWSRSRFLRRTGIVNPSTTAGEPSTTHKERQDNTAYYRVTGGRICGEDLRLGIYLNEGVP